MTREQEMIWHRRRKWIFRISIILGIIAFLLIIWLLAFRYFHKKQNVISKHVVKVRVLKVDSSIFWKKKYHKVLKQRDSLQRLLSARSSMSRGVLLKKKSVHYKAYKKHRPVCPCKLPRTHPYYPSKYHPKRHYSFKSKTPYRGFIF